MRRAAALLVFTSLFSTTSHAADTASDRMARAVNGVLVAPRSLEMEAGGAWEPEGASAPMRVKVGLGRFEPRVGVDLAALGSGSPGMHAGLKVGLIEDSAVGLAGYALSAVPLGWADVWWGETGAALTAQLDGGAQVRVNAAVALEGGGGLAVSGAPLRGLVAVPVGRRLLPFGEIEAVVSDGRADWALQAGLGVNPTDSLLFDVSAGWDIGLRTPVIQAGLTANVGKMR